MLPLTMYAAAWMSFTGGYGWAWVPVVIGFIVIPALEALLPTDTTNLGEYEERKAKKARRYDYFLYLVVACQYAALYLFLTTMQQEMPGWVRAGRIAAMGILCGSFGINAGHELGHRKHQPDNALARLSLLTSLYMHFTTEHNKGHHKYVGTPQDPTSARLGENLYHFWLRSFAGTIASAWKIARTEQVQKQRSWLRNEMVLILVTETTFCLLVALLFGLYPLLCFLLAAGIGILLLSTVNYIEHYGLTRKPTAGNQYERTRAHHSWNSNHVLGRFMLFELSRHSDHHYLASRKYQLLRHHEQSPELPTGYPGSMLLSLVPPLWFWIMNKKIESIKPNA